MLSKVELSRKAMHLIMGLLLAAGVFYGKIDEIIFGWLIVAAFITFWISKKIKLPVIEWFIDNFERNEIKKRFPGKGFLFYMVGVEMCVIFFPKDIAVASILILAIGDSIPSVVGTYFGKVKHPFSNRKFIEGAIAGMILSALAASFFVAWYEAVIASVIAIFVEGIDLTEGMDQIDDNLLVPIGAGIIMLIIRAVF